MENWTLTWWIVGLTIIMVAGLVIQIILDAVKGKKNNLIMAETQREKNYKKGIGGAGK
ncbi:MAG: hypothetical protein QMD65_01825 [Patescibacteria group bacterium]|nr:hypothetical protein [Patescibacteria group bacterium]